VYAMATHRFLSSTRPPSGGRANSIQEYSRGSFVGLGGPWNQVKEIRETDEFVLPGFGKLVKQKRKLRAS
jgi:hypothetical protein